MELSSSLLTSILGLSATLLGLSMFIQILQELYKYLSKSESKSFGIALRDFIGPVADILANTPEFIDLRVRGPFEFLRIKPKGHLLTLKKDELVDALNRITPAWIQRAQRHLQLELSHISNKDSDYSKSWEIFLKNIGSTEKGEPGYWTAYEIASFLEDYGHEWIRDEHTIGKIRVDSKSRVDFEHLEHAFRNRFLGHIEKAGKDYPVLIRNHEYSYRRRNLRQTFVFGFLISLILVLPIQSLWRYASSLSEQETITLANNVLEIYERQDQLPPDSSDVYQSFPVDSILVPLINRLTRDSEEGKFPIQTLLSKESRSKIDGTKGWIYHILGSLVTAILLSFGAPLWNDIAKSIFRFQQAQKGKLLAASEESKVEHA